MSGIRAIEGIAAVIDIDNLDTDQIMPKQFLRGIDKSGLDKGLLWDLRFDGSGSPRPDFVLNHPAWAQTRILIGGANFGCGSSREYAVWGLQQFGIEAVIAPGFGEIFQSNAVVSPESMRLRGQTARGQSLELGWERIVVMVEEEMRATPQPPRITATNPSGSSSCTKCPPRSVVCG